MRAIPFVLCLGALLVPYSPALAAPEAGSDDAAIAVITLDWDSSRQLARLYEAAPASRSSQALLDKVRKEIQALTTPVVAQFLEAKIAAHLAEGRKDLARGDYADARRLFETILVFEPENADALAALQQTQQELTGATEKLLRDGRAARESGREQQAAEDFSRALTLDPGLAEARAEYDKVSRILQASEGIRRLRTDGETVRQAYDLGRQSTQAGRLEEAYYHFQDVLAVDPSHPMARARASALGKKVFREYYNRGLEESKAGHAREAVENLNRALYFDPENAQVRAALDEARVAYRDQKKIESARLYRAGLELALKGGKGTAISLWQKAVELDPDNLEAARGLERLKRRRSQAEAKLLYRKGLDAALKGNKKAALEFWKKAVALDPENLEAKRGLERLRNQ